MNGALLLGRGCDTNTILVRLHGRCVSVQLQNGTSDLLPDLTAKSRVTSDAMQESHSYQFVPNVDS